MWHKTGSLQSLLKQNHFRTGLSPALAAESNHATPSFPAHLEHLMIGYNTQG